MAKGVLSGKEQGLGQGTWQSENTSKVVTEKACDVSEVLDPGWTQKTC